MYENLKEIILEITNETNSACIVSSFYCYIKRDSIVLLLIADAQFLGIQFQNLQRMMNQMS